jgi:hypothetical protein
MGEIRQFYPQILSGPSRFDDRRIGPKQQFTRYRDLIKATLQSHPDIGPL